MKTFAGLVLGLFLCLNFSQLFAQSTDDYLMYSGGAAWATHQTWENDAMVNVNNDAIVWGTTIEYGNGTSDVFIQSIEYPFAGGFSQYFDQIIDFGGCFGYDPYNAPRFMGLVYDPVQDQVIVASILRVAGVGNYTGISLVSLNPYSGAINWTTELYPYGDVTEVVGLTIAYDPSGAIAIAYDFAEIYGSFSNYGVGFAQYDLSGALMWTQNYDHGAGFLPSNPFFVQHLYVDLINGYYVMAGEFDNGGGVEPFIFQVDAGSGALVNDLWHYDLPTPFGGLTSDGSDYYLTYPAAGGELGLAQIDFWGNLNNAAEYDLPNLTTAKTSVRGNDVEFNGNTGYLEVLNWYEDGITPSYGFVDLEPGSFNLLKYTEYDYMPGDQGGVPIAIEPVDVFSTSANPGEDFIVLAHPTGSVMPAAPQELVALNNLPVYCNQAIGDFQGFTQLGFNSSSVPMQNTGEGWQCGVDVALAPYGGRVFDCQINVIGGFRKSAPQAPLVELKLEAYPNPASDQLRVAFEAEGDVQISIIDAIGKVCIAGLNQQKFDISRLSPGLYTVKAEADGQVATQSLLITN